MTQIPQKHLYEGIYGLNFSEWTLTYKKLAIFRFDCDKYCEKVTSKGKEPGTK